MSETALVKKINYKLQLPIEIINEILTYSEDLIIIQYCSITNKEKYIINWKSEIICDIKSLLIMKMIYPLRVDPITSGKNRELYKYGKDSYKQKLKNGTFLYLKPVLYLKRVY